jgi:transposase-like protein
MTKPIVRDPIYRRRRFDAEIIELCVRWYITYRLSYRDLQAMMAERGIVVSHSTILRWVIRYVPEFEKRWNRFARPVNTSWRVDETYVNIRGKWSYLYRAIDEFAEVAAQDHARWPFAEPHGPSASAAGGWNWILCGAE